MRRETPIGQGVVSGPIIRDGVGIQETKDKRKLLGDKVAGLATPLRALPRPRGASPQLQNNALAPAGAADFLKRLYPPPTRCAP